MASRMTQWKMPPDAYLSWYNEHEDDSPTPEAPATIEVQMEQLSNGKRKVVMLTPGEKATPNALGDHIKTLRTPRGTFLYDINKINARAIKRALERDTIGDILGDEKLGYGVTSKKDLEEPAVAVVAKSGDTDVQAVASDKKHLPRAIEAAKRVGSSVVVEDPRESLKRRAQSNRS